MPNITRPRRALWFIVQAFLAALFGLFGQPAEIAARPLMPRREWRRLCKWLRAGEALMRRLILIEAALLPRRSLGSHRARRRSNTETPPAQRVSFRCLAPIAHRRLSADKKAFSPARATRLRSARPLALRAAALLRVFNDPAPCARGLARRLFAAPQRARTFLLHAPETASLIGATGFGAFSHAAAEALHAFDTS